MGVGHNIEVAAKRKGMSLKEISEHLGMPYTTFYNIVKRDSPRIDFELVGRLTRIMDVSYRELLGEAVPPDYDARMEIAVDELRDAFRKRPKSPEEEKDIRMELRNDRRFLLGKADEIAEEYNLPYQSILRDSCLDLLFLGDEYDIEKEAYELVDKLIKLLKGMNDKGRDAVLHHAEELSMIPMYKKE